MYQVRMTDGQILHFSSIREVDEFLLSADPDVVEKVSFTGPDGTRIRMILMPREGWYVTYWRDDAYRGLHNGQEEAQETG